ncbi:hypothetical protein [Cellulomonas shaoxiangyii]|uniref:Uncharacterized protein n=1 Tax=Cellulomonas shaoxiangyii TaxID=2566013 RepID=A0A4P7SPQ7_9CELL|nr:hypothetical protein [Cellulomonas shaoxiangyii]QCB94984.1 hypothetical protein E5225_16850 [Cellulomonas shaoxiangyii]TGY77171.1 hypothetical protein E5226_17295 [Cellulomonas shaoxiangyii]
MNSIENAAQRLVPAEGEAVIAPLEPVAVAAPVLTPVAVAWAAGMAAGAAYHCYKNGCTSVEAAFVTMVEDNGADLSADELLHGRAELLRG